MAEILLSDLGEKRIIREVITPICGTFEPGIGVGDDAALIDIPPGTSLLLSTDKIPEDLIALQLGLMTPFDHGRYLAQVNISDIAAMGGTPLGLVATFALPNDFSLDYLRFFIEGLVSGCAEHGVSVIGGDLGWGTAPCFSATVIGYVEKEHALTRSGSSVGDSVFVSGQLGGFGAALAYFSVARERGLSLGKDAESFLIEKLVRPRPRVEIGQMLSASGICTSCMDITDGVGQSIRELSQASGLAFRILESQLPINSVLIEIAEFLEADVAHMVFGIGLDLELLGTVRNEFEDLPTSLKKEISIIGTVEESDENILIKKNGESAQIPKLGWQHFSSDALSLVKEMYR